MAVPQQAQSSDRVHSHNQQSLWQRSLHQDQQTKSLVSFPYWALLVVVLVVAALSALAEDEQHSEPFAAAAEQIAFQQRLCPTVRKQTMELCRTGLVFPATLASIQAVFPEEAAFCQSTTGAEHMKSHLFVLFGAQTGNSTAKLCYTTIDNTERSTFQRDATNGKSGETSQNCLNSKSPYRAHSPMADDKMAVAMRTLLACSKRTQLCGLHTSMESC